MTGFFTPFKSLLRLDVLVPILVAVVTDSAGICPRLTWKRLIPTSGPTNTVVGPPLAVILVFEVLPIYDPGKRTARGGRKHFETIKLEEHNSQSLEGHPGGMAQ